MAIKPMLFNTEMVRAILSGQKTCTRRVVKPQPAQPYIIEKTLTGFWMDVEDGAGTDYQYKPPCRPGDILYVRETWNGITFGNAKVGYTDLYWYKADDESQNPADKWRPSIHMPREAARIWLRVTGVRVERLQEITDEDIQREGVHGDPYTFAASEFYDRPELKGNYRKAQFAGLWNNTIKPADRERYGWAANPWVWVIEFERTSKEAALGGEYDA